ncbi:MAG: class I SAM-dependent methyltransferase [Rickettsiales bacterium]|nr:class I SAM-dependent methyltransferase [Rickettsiales bacterium]
MKKDLELFAQDAKKYGTYYYASSATLSIDLSSKRRCQSIRNMESFAGKKILDIGCGDGIYTYELLQNNPALVVGIDPIKEVIEIAQKKYANFSNLRFECADLYEMEIPQPKYDIIILRGVLHHLPDLSKAITRSCLMGKRVLVLEPNGYNPLLKIIEKTSSYHISHEEKSYTPNLLRKEFIKNGAKIIKDEYIGLVPTFCPDFLVKFLKFFEALAEKMPIVKNIACGQYVFLAETNYTISNLK